MKDHFTQHHFDLKIIFLYINKRHQTTKKKWKETLKNQRAEEPKKAINYF